MNIEIEYDGEYPNLCRGNLMVKIGTKDNFNVWEFPYDSLESGGSVHFDIDYCEHVIYGDWEVKFPDNFPKELESRVIYEINKKIPHGCCGGCI
jgi:hypothetical protein